MKTKTVILLVVLVLAIGGGGYAGYRGYKSARQAKLIKQTRKYLAKSDPRRALLFLQRALRYNPRDTEACRLMAELTETGRSPAALVWRSRVVELNPRSLDDRLALARTALAFRDYASATNALEGVDQAGKKTASYHNIAGTVAAAANQPAQAETHFLEGARLEPQNLVLQLNLSVVRLQGTNDQALAEARSTLQRISANPTNSTLRCEALRELAVDSMRHKQFQAALALSGQLLQETNSVFRDRLLRVDVLRETQSAEYKPALADLQSKAGTNRANIFELGTWQLARIGPSDTLAWLRSLPVSAQTNQPAALLFVDCYTSLGDWRGLQADLEHQHWAELEFIRHAFKSLALRGQELNSAAQAEWELAVKVANGQQGSLVMLLRLAGQWNWRSEGEELLWTIVNQFPNEQWAVQALSQVLYFGGRTRPLMMLYSQQVKRSPSDLTAKNNLAMIALLLDAKELKPHDLAREVYGKAPTNSSYASTYAFSLQLQEKNAEALKVIERLSPQELETPSLAGYYGLILKATGNSVKAKAYLETASKAQLLPEERKLFDKARAGI